MHFIILSKFILLCVHNEILEKKNTLEHFKYNCFQVKKTFIYNVYSSYSISF